MSLTVSPVSHLIHGGQAVSADGTAVHYLTVGDGPSLLCLHGGLASAADWIRVAQILADRFRLVLMDRRGAGATGPGRGAHTVQAEVQDLAAVVAQLGDVRAIVAHSFGALITMRAMLAESLVDAMVLYEPPLLRDRAVWRGYAEETSALLAAGRYEEIILHALVEQLGLPHAHVERMRADPVLWAQTVGQAPALAAQTGMMFDLAGDYQAMSGIAARTLLVVGQRSVDARFRDAIASLERVLPDARTVTLPGQGHSALRDGPQVLAAAIARFLAGGR